MSTGTSLAFSCGPSLLSVKAIQLATTLGTWFALALM